MKALSIKQPWASLILYGLPVLESVPCDDRQHTSVENTGKVVYRNIENRAWPLPRGFYIPQRIYIHTSKRDDDFDSSFQWLCNLLKGAYGLILLHYSKSIPRGAIIGEVTVVDDVVESDNPWFIGPHGFVLTNPKPYRTPIPYKGRQGFFDVELPNLKRRKVHA